jgi:hypothetical protein
MFAWIILLNSNGCSGVMREHCSGERRAAAARHGNEAGIVLDVDQA